jgi:hypothetical protein
VQDAYIVWMGKRRIRRERDHAEKQSNRDAQRNNENSALRRVLEKAGYTLEARLRNSAIKDGQLIDQVQDAYIV